MDNRSTAGEKDGSDEWPHNSCQEQEVRGRV